MKKIILIMMVLIVMTACGGGGGDSQRSNTEKMIGTWTAVDLEVSYPFSELYEDDGGAYLLCYSSNGHETVGTFIPDEKVYIILEDFESNGTIWYMFEDISSYMTVAAAVCDSDGEIISSGTTTLSFSSSRDVRKDMIKRKKSDIVDILKRCDKVDDETIEKLKRLKSKM